MKQNWTYKKFSEVFNLQMGKTPSRDNLSYWGGDNIWVSIADMKGKYIDSTKEHITDIAVSESGIHKVPQGTAIMSFKLTIGRAAITKYDLFTNEAIMSFEPKDANILLPDYVFYYLKGCKWAGANKAVMGQTLNKKTISENIFAYPSLELQSRIVSELDLLQSIIDKQKAQLKEYDTLAQSIFYDMFGDPVENEKRWDVKKLGEVCEVTSSKRVYQSEWQTTGIPFYRISDFTQLVDNIEFDAELFISPEKYDELKRNDQVPNAGDILVTSRGTLGNCYIVKDNDCFYFQDGMITWLKKINDCLLSLFIVFLFRNNSFRSQIEKNQSGTTVAYLSISMLKKFEIPVPPLSLQQSFAAKIESIEKQKAAISKSIAETEKLFEYTMDKYFN